MKVKVLKIRLSDKFIEQDQTVLDRFLRDLNVIKFESAFVKDEEGYWSVILYYEEQKMSVNDTKTPKYSAEKKEELRDIKGFGKHKIENYGEEIIEILESV